MSSRKVIQRAQFRGADARRLTPDAAKSQGAQGASQKAAAPVDSLVQAPSALPNVQAGQAANVALSGVLDLWRLNLLPISGFTASRLAPTGAPPTSNRLAWKVGLGDPVVSTPTIGLDGTIYVGARSGYLNAIAPDGTLKWSSKVAPSLPNWSLDPAVGNDGSVYVGGADPGPEARQNRLYAFDNQGKPKWSFVAQDTIKGSPLIGPNGSILFGSADRYLYALSPAGELKWKVLADGSLLSSPAMGRDGTIYVKSECGTVYAIGLDGDLRWKKDALLQRGPAWGPYLSPAVGRDGTIYTVSRGSCLYALTPEGDVKWKYVPEKDVLSSPTVDLDGTVYFGTEDCVCALTSDGELKWKFKAAWNEAAPVLGSDGTVYVGSSNEHCLYAIHPDGSQKWKVPAEAGISSSAVISPKGALYVGSRDGALYALVPEQRET